MKSEHNSIYAVLDELRLRPALFLPNTHQDCPFTALLSFVGGLGFADLDPGIPSFWGFTRWAAAYVDGIGLSLPWDSLEQQLGQARAFEAYFETLDIYRRCCETEVQSPVETKLVPTFSLSDTSGNPLPVPLPDRVFIGQFAPSHVFYLGEVYGPRVEKRFPYHRSRAAVVNDAQATWTVDPRAWRE